LQEVDLNAPAIRFWNTPYEGRPFFSNIMMIGAAADTGLLPFDGKDSESVIFTLDSSFYCHAKN
jgi:hypothetical protein